MISNFFAYKSAGRISQNSAKLFCNISSASGIN